MRVGNNNFIYTAREILLISSSSKLVGTGLLLLGVALSVVSLFVFASGWERLSTVLLFVGAAAAAASLFAFAAGWDKLKSYRNSGQVYVKLRLPKLGYPLTFHPTVTLNNIDGSNRTVVPGRTDRGYALVGVMPGEYSVSVEGYGLSTATKSATVLSGQRTDLGEVELEFAPDQFWRVESLPPIRVEYTRQIKRIGPGPDGSAWAVGFRTHRRSCHNDYEVFRRKGTPEWREVVIPQFNKRAERAAAIRLFSDGIFLVGSFGAGTVVSRDGGSSWSALDIPGIGSISEAMELPDGTWLLAGWRLSSDHKRVLESIVKSSDKGASWYTTLELEDNRVSSLLLTSTGRLLAGTSSLRGTISILVSNDLGDTWEKAEISKPKKLRGISAIYELCNGDILAGNEDGTHWKGDFYHGGQLLISRDGGISWESLVERSDWRAIKGIYENTDEYLFVWVDWQEYGNIPPDLQISTDRGNNWHPFSHTFAEGREQTYSVIGEELFVVAGQPLGDYCLMVTSIDTLELNLG